MTDQTRCEHNRSASSLIGRLGQALSGYPSNPRVSSFASVAHRVAIAEETCPLPLCCNLSSVWFSAEGAGALSLVQLSGAAVFCSHLGETDRRGPGVLRG